MNKRKAKKLKHMANETKKNTQVKENEQTPTNKVDVVKKEEIKKVTSETKIISLPEVQQLTDDEKLVLKTFSNLPKEVVNRFTSLLEVFILLNQNQVKELDKWCELLDYFRKQKEGYENR